MYPDVKENIHSLAFMLNLNENCNGNYGFIRDKKDCAEYIGITVDELFEQISNLPIRDLDPKIGRKDIEFSEYLLRIIDSSSVSEKSTKDFFCRFGLPYMYSKLFRKITDGCAIAMINQEIIGIYKDHRTAVRKVLSYKDPVIRSTSAMYPGRIGFEMKDTCSVSN